MMRVWRVVAALSLLLSAASYAQTTDQCTEDRGNVRSGEDGGAPFFDLNNPVGTPTTFDEFTAVRWEQNHGSDTLPSQLQNARIEPEETTIYQIDGLELRSTITCLGVTRLELGKPGTSTNAAIIFALAPSASCMTGSPYQAATAKALNDFLTKYSTQSGGSPDVCLASADTERNGRLLRLIGPGYWSTDTPPQLSINPILAIQELDENGNPDGGSSGGAATVPFAVVFSSIGSDPVLMANDASQSIPFSTVAGSSFNNDLHLSATSNADETDDFHVSVTPDFLAAPGVGEAQVVINTTANTRPRQYIVTVAATSIDAATGETLTSSTSFIVDLQCTPPFIIATDQPAAANASNGSNVDVSVVASGTGPFTYQWYRGFRGMTFSPVDGATSEKLTVPAQGVESYWVRVSNACGSADSNAATVTGH